MATLTIEIPDEALARIERAAAGRGVSADEYVRDAVAQLAPEPRPPVRDAAFEQRLRELREYFAANLAPSPPGHFVDTSRDSIYD